MVDVTVLVSLSYALLQDVGGGVNTTELIVSQCAVCVGIYCMCSVCAPFCQRQKQFFVKGSCYSDHN